MATHSSALAWRIPGRGSLMGCCLWGRTESDTTEVTQQQQQQYSMGCLYYSLFKHSLIEGHLGSFWVLKMKILCHLYLNFCVKTSIHFSAVCAQECNCKVCWCKSIVSFKRKCQTVFPGWRYHFAFSLVIPLLHILPQIWCYHSSFIFSHSDRYNDILLQS